MITFPTLPNETTETILAFVGVISVAIALLSSVGNLIAYIANRGETEKLTRLTSDLQVNVQRLTTGIGQRINRLERIRDLVTGLTQVVTVLRQQSQPHPAKLAAAIQLEMTLPELTGLILAINDPTLSTKNTELMMCVLDPEWEKTWNNVPPDYKKLDATRKRQSDCAIEIHARIAHLVDQTLDADKASTN